ncbi:nuclear transport factor 2 family protein [Streptomyces sp. Je 1-4]|uniref:nuclear transport factor 2 family protein n=1 Tax=Streptomyces TaxID=1883 RepID=UPI0021D923CF|nr:MULTISPECIES: nuclear transport factor 2 family protein [unclassified Streptomyces]UYB41714.1 nuclear transport factor 2 family protein [Streptomyces sp. Je 1-4]UZQ37973.1 nuclear transport factor 2 family protein [Streptomyces sp. Je 1-4] [Streptomyces sp. Je 1-4 4N24]UZQ45390.1 nuclear transport factor 2 family protein [Streptomyces sp. Je 1-4] [Streptomyces sp. Je 1-4 4N24_ara]
MARTGIEAALNDLLFHRDLTVQEAADRHFTPEYRQRTDGQWADRAGFLEHIAHLRTLVTGGHVQVHEELYDGSKYADRHTAHITKKDGSTVRTEVYVFADLAPDGRFSRIEETTLLLQGTDADRNIGSAR